MTDQEMIEVLRRANAISHQKPYDHLAIVQPLMEALAERYPSADRQAGELNSLLQRVTFGGETRYTFFGTQIKRLREENDPAAAADAHLRRARALLESLGDRDLREEEIYQRAVTAARMSSRYHEVVEAVSGAHPCAGDHHECDTSGCPGQWTCPVGTRTGGWTHLCNDCLVVYSSERIGDQGRGASHTNRRAAA